MSLDRSQLIEAFARDDSEIQARTAGRFVIFTLPGATSEPERQVWWNVSDAALASLVAKLSPGATAAYGRGRDGFSVLISRLDEELDTFADARGEVVIINSRDITVEPR